MRPTGKQNANEKCSFKPCLVHFSFKAVEMQGGSILKTLAMTLQLVHGSAAPASSYAFATALFLVHAAGLLLLQLTHTHMLQRQPQLELLRMVVQHLKDDLNSSPAASTSSSVSFNCWTNHQPDLSL